MQDSNSQDEYGLDVDEALGKTSGQIIDDELGDEMDEYGYTGLDQVLDEDKDMDMDMNMDAAMMSGLMDVDGIEYNAGLEYSTVVPCLLNLRSHLYETVRLTSFS